MKCSVFINSDLIDQDDICAFNAYDDEIHFCLAETSGFLPPEVVLILIELARNLGYDAAYDAVKYVISRIILLVVKKKPDECPTRFEVACNDQKFTVKADRSLIDQQMDQLDVASARMLLSAWNGEEQRDQDEQ